MTPAVVALYGTALCPQARQPRSTLSKQGLNQVRIVRSGPRASVSRLRVSNGRSVPRLGPVAGAAAPLVTPVPLFLGQSCALGIATISASSSAPFKVSTPPKASAPPPFLSLRPWVETAGRPRHWAAAAPALRSPWARGSTPASPAGMGMTEAPPEREPLLTSASHLRSSARRHGRLRVPRR
ncbi:hypothetical protein NDU88_005513 [Pleurodeles waltl]|uniref:Uncharacterized protein n=1 Tax=Pleurodeles waltl TaxID=8319 RepID=A0AAV7VNE7_PLEWA|nr:hypothetical protein NDU88_005513 [Pleurodeles waltl]